MDVHVKYFSTYRHALGMAQETVSVPDGTSLSGLLATVLEAHPSLRDFQDAMMLSINKEYAEPDTSLEHGDEVALLPPVSGGGAVRVQAEDIGLDDLVASVQADQAGAVVLFLGTVRADPDVTGLEYEVYEGMVETELAKLRKEAMKRFDLLDLAIVHRSGHLPVGERVVAVVAVAAHRKEAFAGCDWAMDELKRVIPIWKEEVWDT
jgi:molybdopterin synthase catalytic subunit